MLGKMLLSVDEFAAAPRTPLGELTALPRPSSWIWGREMSGEGTETKLREVEGEDREGERKRSDECEGKWSRNEGKRRSNPLPKQKLWLAYDLGRNSEGEDGEGKERRRGKHHCSQRVDALVYCIHIIIIIISAWSWAVALLSIHA